MRKYSLVLLIVLLSSCFDKEEFSPIPAIAYESIYFSDTDTSEALVLSFSFTDGDSNLGLLDEDIFPPYHEFNVFVDEHDSLITASNYDAITGPVYKVPIITSNIQVLGVDLSTGAVSYANGGSNFPVFAFFQEVVDLEDYPFECPYLAAQNDDSNPFLAFNPLIFTLSENQRFLDAYEVQVDEPILVERVPSYNNIVLNFQEKVNGEYFDVDFGEIFNNETCGFGEFSGRIPLFDPDGEQGVITYRIQSLGFAVAFPADSIRIGFYVIDRDLNQSNVAYTPDFVLQDIAVN